MGFLVVFVFGVFSKCVMGFEHFNVTKLRFEYLYGVSAAPATDAHVVDLTLIQGAAAKGAGTLFLSLTQKPAMFFFFFKELIYSCLVCILVSAWASPALSQNFTQI